MARQLTDSEKFNLASKAFQGDSRVIANYDNGISYEKGFVAGLAHNQAKLDKLIAMLIAAGVPKGIIEGVLNEELQ